MIVRYMDMTAYDMETVIGDIWYGDAPNVVSIRTYEYL